MRDRSGLRDMLIEALGSDNIYYQPPTSTKLIYDCIVWHRSYINTEYADNNPYTLCNRYTITYIHRNPDTEVSKKIAWLPMCSFDRRYMQDNLYHDVFTIYY